MKRYVSTLEQFDFQGLVVELGSLVVAIDAGFLNCGERKEYAEKKQLVLAEIANRLDE